MDVKQNGKRPPSLVLTDLSEAGGLAPLVVGSGSGEEGDAMELTPTANYAPPPSDTPAPVIFVLGGPGSGKMTHAQNLADIHDRYRHINMVVVTSQYVKENANECARTRNRSYKGRRQSFSEKLRNRLLSPPPPPSPPPPDDVIPTIAGGALVDRLGPPENVSPSIALALLARELHSSPRTAAFLVSGYPRHLEDLDHYLEKLGRPAGAVLVEWDRRALVRNIELGQIEGAILLDWDDSVAAMEDNGGGLGDDRVTQAVLEAARKELSDFQSRVLPVCERLDNMGVLFAVPGDRPQEQVFKDIQKAHSQIMKSVTLQPSLTQGEDHKGSYREYRREVPFASAHHFTFSATGLRPKNTRHRLLPPMLFVMGGPGSNKGTLVDEIMYLYPGWASVSVGALFRQLVEDAKDPDSPRSDPELPVEKLNMMEDLMIKGELINQDLTLQVLERRILQLSNSEGIVIVGFPRDEIQAQTFEEKFGQVPVLLLIDCSELELGRNLGRRETRMDDNVTGAHRRLALYRKVTLPMLKAFDEKNRLRIIDGDADEEQMIRDLKRAIYVETQRLAGRFEGLRQRWEEEVAEARRRQLAADDADADVARSAGLDNPNFRGDDNSVAPSFDSSELLLGRVTETRNSVEAEVTEQDLDIKSLSHEFSDYEVGGCLSE